ncbi:TPA: hypothetical protein ACGOSS_000708 [Streptococcus suis]
MEKQLPLTPSKVLVGKWQHHQEFVLLLVMTTQAQQEAVLQQGFIHLELFITMVRYQVTI